MGSDPDYGHLRSFGCIAYVHQVKEKINPRAARGVFLGYAQGTKGYRVWLLKEEKVLITKDVVFNEERFFKDLKKEEDREVLHKESEAKTSNKKVTFSKKLEEFEGESSNSGGVDETQTPQAKETTEAEMGSETDSETEETQTHELDNYLLARDRERRTTKLPSKFEDADYLAYALSSVEDLELEEPRSYAEAIGSKYLGLRIGASDEEMISLKKNETWDYVERPKNHKVIGCKWIYKLKPEIPGIEPPRYKGRLVAKGYAQIEGIDYNDVSAPVVKHVSIHILLSAVVNYDLELEQLDVKTAFLHGVPKEIIYMEQLEGYVQKGKEKMVCLLKKSLYGLKQSPREWNHRFDTFMMKQNYRRSEYDPCVYMKGSTVEDMVYLLIYVDDMLIAANQMSKIQKLKDQLRAEFEMKDLGHARKILGMEILRDRSSSSLVLSQKDYIKKVLKTFGMEECRAVSTPLGSQFKLASLTKDNEAEQTRGMEDIPYTSAVGSLMYAMIGFRPDLAYAVEMVCRYMSKPGKDHWLAVKWIMRYIKGSLDLGLTFIKEDKFEVRGYCDSDYAADLDKRRSIAGYIFTVGGNTLS